MREWRNVMANGRTVETRRELRPVLTKIVGKFQTTIPPEVRNIFNLREGDLLEWSYSPDVQGLVVVPKRPQSLAAQFNRVVEDERVVAVAAIEAEPV